MKPIFKYICVIISVFIGVIITDFFGEKVLYKMMSELPNTGNETSKAYFTIHEVESPCLIVGSSRASHHYIPSTIEDSLNIETYNVGRDGCFFSYNCAIINAVINRYTPEVIIWEFGTADLLKESENRLEFLYPFYNKKSQITKIINESEDNKRKIQLQSGLYKYNSIAIRVITRSLTKGADEDKNKGYIPIKPEKHKSDLALEFDSIPSAELDPVRIKQFEETLQSIKAKGIKLFVFHSPMYRLVNTNEVDKSALKILEICSKYDIPVFDNRDIPEFMEHPEYFKDHTHLNHTGAERYTKIVIEQIRPYL